LRSSGKSVILITVSDQIITRFGVLGRFHASAVRQAIEAAAYAALVQLNAAHLRVSVIAELRNVPVVEPPSHRWYELMIECFGEDQAVLLEMGSPRNPQRQNIYPQVVVPNGEAYLTRETEERTIRGLFAAAGTFLVAESTTLGNQIEQWDIAGHDPSLCEELCSLADRAGAVGLVLFNHAKAGTWRDLLLATMSEPTAVIASLNKDHSAADPATVALPETAQAAASWWPRIPPAIATHLVFNPTGFRDRLQAVASNLGRVRRRVIAAVGVSALVATVSAILMMPPALDVVAYGVTTQPRVGTAPCGPGGIVVFTFTVRARGSGTLHYIWRPDKDLSNQPVRNETVNFDGPPQTENLVYVVPHADITGPQTGMTVEITSPESFRGASYASYVPNTTFTCP
jgi:hypothetical protein